MLNLFLPIYDFVCAANIALLIILLIEVSDEIKTKYPEYKPPKAIFSFYTIGAFSAIILFSICPIMHLYLFYLITIKATWFKGEVIKSVEKENNLGGNNNGME